MEWNHCWLAAADHLPRLTQAGTTARNAYPMPNTAPSPTLRHAHTLGRTPRRPAAYRPLLARSLPAGGFPSSNGDLVTG
ncbi:unnamed protein product [Urochloa humidicola]